MNLDGIVNVSIFAAGTVLVGIGVGSKDLGWGSVVVGGILLALVIVSNLRGGRKE